MKLKFHFHTFGRLILSSILLTMIWICLPTLVLAQKGLKVNFNAGSNLSYNRLLSDRPLPPDPSSLRKAGPCLDLGLYYRFHSHFSIDFHAKSASIAKGIILKNRYIIEIDSVTGMIISEVKGLSAFSNHSLFHIQAGASVYPIVRPPVEWKIGIGLAPVLVNRVFALPLGLRLNGADQLFSATFAEYRLQKTGLLLNFNTSLTYNLSDKSAIVLTLNHNQGLKDIFEQRSSQYFYLNKRTNLRDQYNVRLINNGSYSSCTIGYSYRFSNSPQNVDRLAADQTGWYVSLSGGVNVSYNRLISESLLPPDPVALRRAGSTREFGLHNRFHPRGSIDFLIKAASIKRGLIGKETYVAERDTAGMIINTTGIGMNYVSTSPLHLQVGASFYPIVGHRLEWKVGTGLSAMRITNGFTPPIGFEMDQAEDLYFTAGFETEKRLRRTAWLVNFNTSIAYKVGQKGAIMLSMNHNQGFADIYEHQSFRYFYFGKTNNSRANYDVKLINNASYSALNLGYCHRFSSYNIKLKFLKK